MPWAKPFDDKGRLVGSHMILTLGGDPDADPVVPGHPIPLTSFRRRAEPTEVEAKDSGDWDATDKLLYGTSMTVSLGTSGTAEGFVRLSETPDWVIALLYSESSVPFSFKPDGTNVLLSGLLKISNFADTYPAEDWCTFSFDYKVQGKPVRGASIAVPS